MKKFSVLLAALCASAVWGVVTPAASQYIPAQPGQPGRGGDGGGLPGAPGGRGGAAGVPAPYYNVPRSTAVLPLSNGLCASATNTLQLVATTVACNDENDLVDLVHDFDRSIPGHIVFCGRRFGARSTD